MTQTNVRFAVEYIEAPDDIERLWAEADRLCAESRRLRLQSQQLQARCLELAAQSRCLCEESKALARRRFHLTPACGHLNWIHGPQPRWAWRQRQVEEAN
jgi:hypothetical protein